jgi:hypothetical protein
MPLSARSATCRGAVLLLMAVAGCGGASQKSAAPTTTVTQMPTVTVTQPSTTPQTVTQPQPSTASGRCPRPPCVTYLDYAPKPLYDDISALRVRFTTTGGAPRHWMYNVTLLIEGPTASPLYGCSAIAQWPPVGPTPTLAGRGRTWSVRLRGDPVNPNFCHGRAQLDVELDTLTGHHPRVLRKVDFSVLHAR